MAVRLSVEPKFSRFHAFYGALVKYSVGAPNRKFWIRYCLTINSYDLFAGRLKWSDIKQLLIYLTGFVMGDWCVWCATSTPCTTHGRACVLRASGTSTCRASTTRRSKNACVATSRAVSVLSFITSSLPVLKTGVML